MSQRLKEVDEESLGTVFYNFCMNHNSVHKVPDLRGIFQRHVCSSFYVKIRYINPPLRYPTRIT